MERIQRLKEATMINYWTDKLKRVGALLFQEKLVDARAGNLSVKVEQRMIITRRGSHLGLLKDQSFILLDINREDTLDERASSEVAVHRSIYKDTQKRAVVHAHPPKAVALSFKVERIVPKDSEGKYLLGEVDIVSDLLPGSFELAREVSKVLKTKKLVIVKGHGVFSADEDPFYAYSHISVLEYSCKILLE
ncbi:MAG: class II aldolase/adducin family protein [Aquificaceae bacterium]